MKAKIKPIFLILIGSLLLLGGIWFFLHQSTSKVNTEELSADDILETIVETEEITTNLNSGGFIQLRFKIQTSSVEAKEELSKRDFQVRNIVLREISAMTEDQVKSPSGMANVEKQIKNDLNKMMQNGKIIQIFTTNKMIQ